MTRAGKTLEKVLRGSSDANVSFADLAKLLDVLGFSERVRGSHHIFSKAGVEEIPAELAGGTPTLRLQLCGLHKGAACAVARAGVRS